jgi:hypothetical protein
MERVLYFRWIEEQMGLRIDPDTVKGDRSLAPVDNRTLTLLVVQPIA